MADIQPAVTLQEWVATTLEFTLQKTDVVWAKPLHTSCKMKKKYAATSASPAYRRRYAHSYKHVVEEGTVMA